MRRRLLLADRGSPVKVAGGGSWLWLATHAGDSCHRHANFPLLTFHHHPSILPSLTPQSASRRVGMKGDVGRFVTELLAFSSLGVHCTLSQNPWLPAARLGMAKPSFASSQPLD